VTDPTPDEKAISGRHAAYLRQLFDGGTLIFAARVLEEGGLGYVAVRAGDIDAARALMHADPQYKEGAMHGSVHAIGMADFKKT
jgi:uncharacterized protein YciI